MKHALALILFAAPAFADAPVVENVTYSNGRFDVTLSHPDTGWDHYADGWRVELADGTVLGTRALAHPHVDEQPFTRSSSIAVPDGVSEVFIRASDTLDGWAEERHQMMLP
ncbi:hypothetical protein Q4555_06910 [Octadecabacter sp. 1_MG-2023]|uniref:hypothetical protein n=1 Tax=unclassified Octadecabacter TaxID=196158 RepID=UPI001C084D58|nr:MULTISPECIES: hypothetical protein [unclassified Octadecabacter]MBU2994319.1 hypothetical protein [Octadecabacter sp. B2R22]MDO6734392.1 hypothetical protein [Octadecabacter sp. 1_MG-2023]